MRSAESPARSSGQTVAAGTTFILALWLWTTCAAAAHAGRNGESWVESWATAQQLTKTEMPDWMLPPPKASSPSPIPPTPERLHNQTVRMVVRTSIGGRQVRVQFANAQGFNTVRIGAARIGILSGAGKVEPGSDRAITIGGRADFSLEPGASIISDPVSLSVAPLGELLVSLYVPGDSGPPTIHPLGLHTTYISDGNTSGADTPQGDRNRSYFWLTGIDVLAPANASALVAFGDSITDGFSTTPDTNRAWPALLAQRLATESPERPLAVLNLGISGNRLLHDGAGANGLARFDRDVLSRPGVSCILLLEGINDISFAALPGAPPEERIDADALFAGYLKFIEKAHVRGLRVVGATLLPWEGVWTFNEAGESLRQRVNQWIRSSGRFDGIIDFDAITRDPAHPRRLAPAFDSGDHVHPNDAGNHAMAHAIDLVLLQRCGSRT